jgi:CopA family copper-resistance protein
LTDETHAFSRRRFIGGATSTGLLSALGWRPAASADGEIVLSIGELPVNITGANRTATAINGSVPGPLLRLREGDEARIRVVNTLRHGTSVHWHGLVLPSDMDGVPGLSYDGIAPGTNWLYRFPLRQSGTYWYHAHSAFQEQTGLYGPLVIESREPEPFSCDREHVILLSDWSDEQPEKIFTTLKKQSGYYDRQRQTLAELRTEARRHGWTAALAERRAWARMRMSASDRADVTGATYTYLVNGVSPGGNWTAQFTPGERVRLRFINGSSMSIFDVRIPGLEMTVVAADGLHVKPVTIDEFRLAAAETLDVIVTPSDAAYTLFAQSIDRSGFARATLAPRVGMVAPVPSLDRPTRLRMSDMGHGAHGAHGGASTPGAPAGQGVDEHAGHGASEHAGHAGSAVAAPASSSIITIEHPATERTFAVDMQVDAPATALDDPGIGLRAADLHVARDAHAGDHRVLTLSQLRSLHPLPYAPVATRTIQLHLTGHMERYIFSFDGVKFADAAPIRVAHGEVVRIVLVNDTMMEHPIHLHGLWSDVLDEHGEFVVRKHTLSVPPGSQRSYLVHAYARGRWAYHCHLLFHMEAGMFREVRVE